MNDFRALGSIVFSEYFEMYSITVPLVLKSLANRGPTVEELERAKRRSLVEMELVSTKPELLGFKLAWAHLNQQDARFLQSAQRLQAISKEDVREVCEELFRLENSCLALIGPKESDLETRLYERVERCFNHRS